MSRFCLFFLTPPPLLGKIFGRWENYFNFNFLFTFFVLFASAVIFVYLFVCFVKDDAFCHLFTLKNDGQSFVYSLKNKKMLGLFFS